MNAYIYMKKNSWNYLFTMWNVSWWLSILLCHICSIPFHFSTFWPWLHNLISWTLMDPDLGLKNTVIYDILVWDRRQCWGGVVVMGREAVMMKRRISVIMVIMIITNITLVTWCVSGSVWSSSHIKSIFKILFCYLPFFSLYSLIMV